MHDRGLEISKKMADEAFDDLLHKYRRVPNFRRARAKHPTEKMNDEQRTRRRQSSHRRGQIRPREIFPAITNEAFPPFFFGTVKRPITSFDQPTPREYPNFRNVVWGKTLQPRSNRSESMTYSNDPNRRRALENNSSYGAWIIGAIVVIAAILGLFAYNNGMVGDKTAANNTPVSTNLPSTTGSGTTAPAPGPGTPAPAVPAR